MLTAHALERLPEISAGDDLAALIAVGEPALEPGDVIVVAHKAISKAEGRVRLLADVEPSARARELGGQLGKDPRHVQVVLEESRQVLRAAQGVLITVTHHGFVCANAGVDTSNLPGDDAVLLLPQDPDASARRLRRRLRDITGKSPGVLITDSFGRAWRHGQADVAIGCAGISPLDDWRGSHDALGRPLRATWIAVADELASAADLARRKDSSQPIVIVSGAGRHVRPDDGPGAVAILRPEIEDLFR